MNCCTVAIMKVSSGLSGPCGPGSPLHTDTPVSSSSYTSLLRLSTTERTHNLRWQEEPADTARQLHITRRDGNIPEIWYCFPVGFTWVKGQKVKLH